MLQYKNLIFTLLVCVHATSSVACDFNVPASGLVDTLLEEINDELDKAEEIVEALDIFAPPLIPKNIFMLWDKGWDNAPTWQKRCLQSWRYHNPDYVINAIDMDESERLTDVTHVISSSSWKRMKIQAKSDVIRVLLLAKYGGVWVDSSVLCNAPLSTWLNQTKDIVTFLRTDKKAHVAPKDSGGKLIRPWVTSWFIAANKESFSIQLIKSAVVKFWSQDRLNYEYFWLHRIISDIYKENARFARTLQGIRSADPMHCLTHSFAPMYKRCNQKQRT